MVCVLCHLSRERAQLVGAGSGAGNDDSSIVYGTSRSCVQKGDGLLEGSGSGIGMGSMPQRWAMSLISANCLEPEPSG